MFHWPTCLWVGIFLGFKKLIVTVGGGRVSKEITIMYNIISKDLSTEGLLYFPQLLQARQLQPK